METREQRGIAIADGGKVRRKDHLWIVPSQVGAGTYVVEPGSEASTCTCPDFETRGGPCKHIFAVEYTIRRETDADGNTTVSEQLRLTYRQDWPAYNAAQVVEKERVAAMLHSLCSAIENPVHENGRPPFPLADSVFCAVMKVYGGTSGRRAMTDMRDYAAKGYIDRAPHFNSVLNALENPILTPILQAMITETAKTLKPFEEDFAVDSSGFSTSVYDRWFDHKYGREMTKAQWVKSHITIGVNTHIVTAVEITDGFASDTSQFMDLVDRTAANFRMARVSADKAYSSRTNLSTVRYHGAEPFIAFKKNARTYALDVWGKAHQFFLEHREQFLLHYHQRSNVETAFHMIKSKFGTRVRSKTPLAQKNEILAKVLCHNLCCLVSAAFELGVEATFWKAESVA